MKTFIAVFEVPDEYTPRNFLANADGWFVDGYRNNLIPIGAVLKEVTNLTYEEKQ